MKKPYSPLRYPGGKAKLADFLIAVLKCNGANKPHYIEPYAGGAGAALCLLFGGFVESITINDADPRMFCFWKAVTSQNKSFTDLLAKVEVSVDEWSRQREIYNSCDCSDILRLGFSTFYLNRTSRSGIIHNGGPIGGVDQTGNYLIDARFNREDLINRISHIGSVSQQIQVSSIDGLALLKKINKCRTVAKKSFVYLDPPYYVKGPELYMNRFTKNQHWELAMYLSKKMNFPWIMTYDDVEAVRTLYEGFSRFCFNLQYSANGCKKGQELLIHPDSVEIPDVAKKELPVVA